MKLNRTASLSTALFLFLMPALLVAQESWQPLPGPCGGPVRGMAMDAQGALYCATANGMFRSADKGDLWAPCFASLPAAQPLQVAVLPRDIFIVVSAGGVIYRSIDGGVTWAIAATIGNCNAVSEIVSYNSRYFVGINTSDGALAGVYRSLDAGASWTLANTGMTYKYPQAMAVNPINGTVFVNTFNAGVYRSTNGGDSWTAANSGITLSQRFGYALCTDQNGIVYAGFSSWSQGSPVSFFNGGIFRSTNDGSSWTQANAGMTDPDCHYLASSPHGELFAVNGQENGALYMSANSGGLWVEAGPANLSSWPASIIAPPYVYLSSNFGVSRSMDNGAHWNISSEGLLSTSVAALASGGGDTLWAGTWSSGAYRSTDAGQKWTPQRNGLETFNVTALAHSGNGTVFAAADNDRLYRTTDAGGTWTRAMGDISSQVTSIVVTDSGHVFCSGWFVWTSGGKSFWKMAAMRSTDDGATWSYATDTATQTVRPVTMAVGNNGTIYTTTMDGKLYRSPDHGWSWQQLTFPFTANNTMRVFCDRAGNALYVGSVKGVYRSLDEGATWAMADSSATYSLDWSFVKRGCTMLAASPQIGGVRITTDDGATWDWANTGLGGKDVQSLLVVDNGSVYAGTSGSAYGFTSPLSRFPGRVLLTSPADSATSVPLDTELRWSAVCGATSYRLQVASDVAFLRIVLDTVVLSGNRCGVGGLAAATAYYWRVRGISAEGQGAWSAAWSFTTLLLPPAKPELREPYNHAENVSKNVTFRWSAVSGAQSYHLQVSLDSAFTPPLRVDQGSLTGASQMVTGLLEGTRYFWRLAAVNAAGSSPWSDVWSFTVVEALPAAPLLVSPANGADSVQLMPQSEWAAVTGATSYRLELGADANFMPPLLWDSSGIAATQVTLPLLQEKSRYYWRVNATNARGSGPWSVVWSFTTMERWHPAAPTLLAPADSVDLRSLADTLLQWRSVAGAQYYSVEVANDRLFSWMYARGYAVADTFFRVDLNVNARGYWWRVRAVAGADSSGWSTVWMFYAGSLDAGTAQAQPQGCVITDIYPVPARDYATITIRTEGDAGTRATLLLYDAMGRLAVRLLDDELPCGEHSVTVPLRGLPAGVYFCILRAGASADMRSMLVGMP